MESGDGNEFRESEWRRLLGLLDARVAPPSGDVIDLEAMRKKRAAGTTRPGRPDLRTSCRPQSSGAGEEPPRREDE